MPLDKVDLSKYLSDVFIETGTHRGDGVRCAINAGFHEIYSCDTDIAMMSRMPPRLYQDGRVFVGVGVSNKWLPRFIQWGGYRDFTFWLDAHPSGELSFTDCALREELQLIKAHQYGIEDITILIDDMRLFSADDQARIIEMVYAIRPDVNVSRIDGHCDRDILVGQM